MRNLLTLSMLLSALLLLVVPAALAAELAGDEFTIELPVECGEPQRQEQTLQSPTGDPIHVVIYSARAEDGAPCTVVHSEYSGTIMGAADMIDKERDTLLKQLNDQQLKVTMEREREITVDGFEGRSILFTANEPREIFGRTDFVVADDRLYQVIYIGFSYEARENIEQAGLFSSLSISGPAVQEASTETVPETATTAANNQG